MIATFVQTNFFNHMLAYWNFACASLYLLLLLLVLIRPDIERLKALWLHVGFIVSRLLYGALLSIGQYVHWAGNPFTAPLVSLPISSNVPLPGLLALFSPLLSGRHGYFLQYMLGHYWLGLLWGIAFSFLLLGALVVLRKARPRMLSRIDIDLFFGASLIVGWPNVLLLVFLVFTIFLGVVIVKTVSGDGRSRLYPAVLGGLFIVLVTRESILRYLPALELLRFVHN